MKLILLVLTVGVLLATTGCVLGHHDRHDPADVGVDHGEHPGDLDHGNTMQK